MRLIYIKAPVAFLDFQQGLSYKNKDWKEKKVIQAFDLTQR